MQTAVKQRPGRQGNRARHRPSDRRAHAQRVREQQTREKDIAEEVNDVALRSQETATDQRNADAPGVLTLDRSKHIVSFTPSAERWLLDLEDLCPAWRESHSLPVVVSMVARALEYSLASEPDRNMNSSPKMRVRGRSGRWLTLYGSLSEPAPGHSSEMVIVVEPTSPRR